MRERGLLIESVAGGGRIAQRALAAELGLSVSRVNRLVAELVEEGLIEVDAGRQLFAYLLTERGRALHWELQVRRKRAVIEEVSGVLPCDVLVTDVPEGGEAGEVMRGLAGWVPDGVRVFGVWGE